ncbi:peptide/nickel transport system substrate-binding protein [Streptomyces sp. SAI-208]|jgi:peptide/nickel transport system substrate-binding protein|uniref:ABC transporter substrate-binding protein n=1 Tax=unclassified Streptomyces TaxID=2593676 RepID=UPI0024764A32|nr:MULTISPECIES: ABC transporter substrate-binding protein [unclassified Streptomyces]MDH6516736.1 peptide/nickel transport system substrate-binding protein [Streptomyces sp. SAI-090]MDH6548948.1 peptide/nickel transport system substrate-binding protein [Streptomyces sp. SAI-041]MDH6568018.1 peptide/nickel transport system substrate-binding protein [Streptomyces sp. SAI-117]MDH6587034.1 peptide/nickel transport system substrate-binding protein [Streptomyces sp. SAI-133]MDH6607557.1 peptide/nic
MSHNGVALRAVTRSVGFLTAGALAVTALSGCSSEDHGSKPLAEQDIAPAARDRVADGGTLHWAVDAVPETLNTFQADADATTTTVAQAVLPSMYRLDANGRPQVNPDYLESAKVVETEPRQVVLYKLNQQAVWSDGREIGAADFAAQWRALSGKDSAYWTARNAGYERIQKIERGADDLEVKVTFARPYADWRSLFSPLYPKDVMGTPDSFNDSARKKLKVTAGPFQVKKVDRKDDEITLTRNPRWWGHPAKLNEIVLRAVPRDKRATALAAGAIELAEIDPEALGRISLSAHAGATPGGSPVAGPGGVPAHRSGGNLEAADALRSWALAHGDDEEAADEELSARQKKRRALAAYEREQAALKGFEVRRSLEPAYTQLALNGASGPLADERVRRAVARAIDRKALAGLVLSPLGLPAEPVGSHLALSGQDAYADNSGALGGQDAKEARALLADAGWVPGGPVDKERKKGEKAAGAESGKAGRGSRDKGEDGEGDGSGDDGNYIVGEDDKSDDKDPKDHHEGGDGPRHLAQDGKQYANKLNQGGAPGAYAPKGTAAPADAATKVLAKNGKALALRFVLPSGPGSETLRTVAGRISLMLGKVGIRTEISKVSDESYFKDHIASGEYDLALYSWPASAFPATDARPIFAKPVPAADGSLNVEQNYTRVGTDQVDQLFDQAVATLDEGRSRSLIRKADSRIWAAAGSIPLYQRPQLTAAKKDVVNAGSFGFQTPVYEDMGFLKKGAKASAEPTGD